MRLRFVPLVSAVFAAGASVSFGSPSELDPYPASVRLSEGDKIRLLETYRMDRFDPSFFIGTPRVFAVFYDVDGDWRTDAFVSSDSEKLSSGENIWRLYRNETNGWKAISQTFSEGRVSIPTVLLAGTNDFIAFRLHWNDKPALRIHPGCDPQMARAQIAWDYNKNNPVHLPVEELRDCGIDDPSLVPLLDDPQDPGDFRKYRERRRVLVDLNQDGEEDLLLSEFHDPEWGVSVFFRHGDKFYRAGSLDLDIGRGFAIEEDHDSWFVEQPFASRIWIYSRCSGSEGLLGYYRIGEREISPFIGITVYPGDGGTEIGRRVVDAVFGTKPEMPYRLQHSVTSTNGIVRWMDDRSSTSAPHPKSPEEAARDFLDTFPK